MAPLSGEVLVLDEVQWADDSERGSAWTRLLLAGEYKHILLLGAVEALPLIQNAFPDAEVRFFERKAPLDWTGAVSFQSLKPGTVVVAFSRRAVLALAGELNRRQPGRVAVLYGAMPLGSRRLEIERFMNGQADVCCATDVLGHGVNLPCETLLFAESQKFDGEERRDLHAWEIAQIAGRAGRFGLVERGHVGVLTGIVWANADPDLIESALTPHVPLPGGHMGYRVVDTARIRPRLEDLPVESPQQLAAALRAWHTAALRRWATEGWLSVESIGPLLVRLDAVQRRLKERGRSLSLEQTWKLVNAPVDEDNVELLATLALAVAGDRARAPCSPGCSTRTACATPRSRTPSRPPAPRASCAGSRSSTRTSAASRSSAPPSSRPRRPSASARSWRPRCAHRRSAAASRAGRAAPPGSRSASAATAAGSGARSTIVAMITIAATTFGRIRAQLPSEIPYANQSRKPTKSTIM